MVVMTSGTANGYSQDGSDAVSNEIIIGGFAKNTIAHIVLIGWTFNFPSGDTPICQMYLSLQQPITGSWQNARYHGSKRWNCSCEILRGYRQSK